MWPSARRRLDPEIEQRPPRPPAPILSGAAGRDQESDASRERQSAHDRRQRQRFRLVMSDVHRPDIHHLVALCPRDSAVGEADNPDDDENEDDELPGILRLNDAWRPATVAFETT